MEKREGFNVNHCHKRKTGMLVMLKLDCGKNSPRDAISMHSRCLKSTLNFALFPYLYPQANPSFSLSLLHCFPPREEIMETNHFILVLISLSSLFSFSASSLAPSPSPSPSPTPASALDSSEFGTSFNFPEPEGDNFATFNILPTSVDPGLQRICGDTDHPIECLTTTAPFLKENVAIEPVSILQVGIEAMNVKAREALAQATKLLLNPTNAEHVSSCLETCIDSYNDILDTNQRALDAVAVRDLYQLSMELSSNVENVHACADAFDEADVESPIKDIDSLLGKMISNSLAIGVDLVHF